MFYAVSARSRPAAGCDGAGNGWRGLRIRLTLRLWRPWLRRPRLRRLQTIRLQALRARIWLQAVWHRLRRLQTVRPRLRLRRLRRLALEQTGRLILRTAGAPTRTPFSEGGNKARENDARPRVSFFFLLLRDMRGQRGGRKRGV
ncbi:hypothetical protein IscW_ISCW001451 [Ixodes scapularis]|uniref:Uncharacterized protein n=1 Tax=Ixodes scapularis TaxID=6945 RepID=B7P6M4_IXOSC|nr:hypothetical protein IscW_ISCW001451 [Ixodes scapularis]|eukprot:XP_002409023.1 hypothetical protein IscW_ISCW001451 [Ixodes scapularis]